jgi:hypothetical protein
LRAELPELIWPYLNLPDISAARHQVASTEAFSAMRTQSVGTIDHGLTKLVEHTGVRLIFVIFIVRIYRGTRTGTAAQQHGTFGPVSGSP